ncbi:sigma-E factor negative regulatory protein [Chitinimonas naiadis]
MQEKLSALMDGEWDDHELEKLIAAMDQDEASSSWRDYHLIGDAMNQRAVLSDDFMANFSARLDAEPAILAPNALRRRGFVPGKRWVAMSMAASVVLVSATAWYVAGSMPGSSVVTPSQLATASSLPVAANQAAQPVADDLNPYLVAHQTMLGNPGFNHRAVILTGAEAERAVVRR